MVWIWAGVFIATVMLEVTTAELVSIWFALGSFIAFIMALCGVGQTAQIIVFIIVAVLTFAFFRPLCMKLLKDKDEKTNVDSMIGTVHKLLKDIDKDNAGEIKINGVSWRVVSKNNEPISANEDVKIVEVHGNKFVVEKGE